MMAMISSSTHTDLIEAALIREDGNVSVVPSLQAIVSEAQASVFFRERHT